MALRTYSRTAGVIVIRPGSGRGVFACVVSECGPLFSNHFFFPALRPACLLSGRGVLIYLLVPPS